MLTHYEYYSKSYSYTLSDILSRNKWDFFFSAYTDAYRVQEVFNHVNSNKKIWLKFAEYCYDDEHNIDNCVSLQTKDEKEIITVWDNLNIPYEARICIDSTGFIRPYLAFILKYAHLRGYKNIDILYTEPTAYEKKENTEFSKGSISKVRQIMGFEGIHSDSNSNDVLIINSGFDDKLITAVAENKKNTKKYQLIGFPSLRANMYQQGMLRVGKASDAFEYAIPDMNRTILAPANDPFVTAANLESMVNKINSDKPISNLYLSPLATKPQLIGMVLFYLYNDDILPMSIIFPFSEAYSKETGVGLARTWLYSLEFHSKDELRRNGWIDL